MDLVWDTLTAAAFGELEKNDFEDLCCVLLNVEWSDRHDLRSKVEVPGPSDTADGGCDLHFSVNAPPHELAGPYHKRYKVRPLTPDEGNRVYSCKTGKTWEKKVLEEAKDFSARGVDALENNGSFTIFVNCPVVGPDNPPLPKKIKGPPPAKTGNPGTSKVKAKTSKSPKAASTEEKISLLDKLARAYAERIPTGCPTEVELRSRIQIIDANELCTFLQGRRPLLPPRLAKMLGLSGIPNLLSLDDWRRNHEQDRPPASVFVPDQPRKLVRDQIASVLTSRAPNPYDRALWIAGPPGIGKTRLVLEALANDPRLARRVLVAPTHVEGIAAIREHGVFERFGALVLVVDDCPPHALLEMAPFLSKLGEGTDAAFVVLTPHAFAALPLPGLNQRIEIAPLGQSETAAIIQQQVGTSIEPEAIERLAGLSDGYPWFAALVAQEIAQGASPPMTVAAAADLALASRRDEKGRWHDAVIENARALFAVMLTEDVDWAELSDEERGALHEAVDAPSWSALVKAREACEIRGLLRVRAAGKFKYVTPEILAREVARKLLTPPPGGGGPGPIGARLRRVPQWTRSLYERLVSLGLNEVELKMLAAEVVRQVDEAGPGLSAFGPGGVPGAALLFAASHLPRETAALLHAHIEEVLIVELRSRRDVRRDFVGALERISRREGCFEDAEATLFRLARAENEVYGNNATNVWSKLFFVGMNPTKSPWEERFTRLRDRCRSGTKEERLVALGGLAAALSHQRILFSPDGGEPPEVMPAPDAKRARTDAWKLLIACVVDDEPTVARDARKIVSRELRSTVREGILDDFAAELAAVLPHFDEKSLLEVRDAVAHAETYEREILESSVILREALFKLQMSGHGVRG